MQRPRFGRRMGATISEAYEWEYSAQRVQEETAWAEERRFRRARRRERGPWWRRWTRRNRGGA